MSNGSLVLNIISPNSVSNREIPQLSHRPMSLHIINQNNEHKKGKINKYTLSIFLERAKEVHGDKYNYDQITTKHIHGSLSKVPIICNLCRYNWSTSINSHINNKYGCPQCAGKIPWTYERFIKMAYSIHGDNYNYNNVSSNDVKCKNSRVLIVCNTCQYKWVRSRRNPTWDEPSSS